MKASVAPEPSTPPRPIHRLADVSEMKCPAPDGGSPYAQVMASHVVVHAPGHGATVESRRVGVAFPFERRLR